MYCNLAHALSVICIPQVVNPDQVSCEQVSSLYSMWAFTPCILIVWMIADYIDNTQKMCVLYRVHHLCIWLLRRYQQPQPSLCLLFGQQNNGTKTCYIMRLVIWSYDGAFTVNSVGSSNKTSQTREPLIVIMDHDCHKSYICKKRICTAHTRARSTKNTHVWITES